MNTDLKMFLIVVGGVITAQFLVMLFIAYLIPDNMKAEFAKMAKAAGGGVTV